MEALKHNKTLKDLEILSQALVIRNLQKEILIEKNGG
jgi:hypothetical protein